MFGNIFNFDRDDMDCYDWVILICQRFGSAASKLLSRGRRRVVEINSMVSGVLRPSKTYKGLRVATQTAASMSSCHRHELLCRKEETGLQQL